MTHRIYCTTSRVTYWQPARERTQRIALYPDLPNCPTEERNDYGPCYVTDLRPYRMAWRLLRLQPDGKAAPTCGPGGDLYTSEWFGSCLGGDGDCRRLGDIRDALHWLRADRFFDEVPPPERYGAWRSGG